MRFPWSFLFALASQRLGWTPQTIWAATPTEILMAVSLPGQRAANLSRRELDLLCDAFPDQSGAQP
ncbi:phage tail assembly chaperone [uncultured Cohaesibacter sp.]|uniref:phage tail assembly chaperone n=1 Tax=uncultured Cohaesibacter sp. TaxID=1002546 RepID=UPI00374A4329